MLVEDGENELAAQVSQLRIVERCRCGDDFCATFYPQPRPEGRWAPTHRTLPLDFKDGTVIVDVVSDKIACVEVLDRPEIRAKLLALFP